MPHALPLPSAPPDRAESARPPDPVPAVQPSSVCPSCGRRPAIVFPVLRTGGAAGEVPLVCLACCPRVTGETPAG